VPHEHVPHIDFVETRLTFTLEAAGPSSSGSDPMTWQNSSMFDAADVAIRNSYLQRDAFIRASIGSMSNGSPACLLAAVQT
jgi:hypothetical protein